MRDDDESRKNQSARGSSAFARRALIAVCMAAMVTLLLLLVWHAVDVLLLIFGGVLFGILLRGCARLLRGFTGLSRSWALLIVTLLLVCVVGAGAWLLAGRIAAQTDELTMRLPQAVGNLRAQIEQYGWGRRVLEQAPDADALAAQILSGRGGVLGRATGIISGVFGAIVNALIVIVIGFYLAFQENLYTNGIIRLVPFGHRGRAGEVLAALDDTLWRWLVGRLLLMVVTGSITAIGLWFLGMPLALTLGLLVGILGFIPNIGPLIAATPAILLALLQSPQQALFVGLLYVGIQMLDGYLLTPLVDRRSVELPPVLTISAQVLLGVLLGITGVVLASPLTAVALVLVKMLYIEDTLGDKITGDDVNTGGGETA